MRTWSGRAYTVSLQEQKYSAYDLEESSRPGKITHLTNAHFFLAVSFFFARWSVRLSAFKFSVKHIKGSQNTNADALSRARDATPNEITQSKRNCSGCFVSCWRINSG